MVYGAINALVGLPTLVSFSIIVYGTRGVYRPYLPDVAKLRFLASAIHQAVFAPCPLCRLLSRRRRTRPDHFGGRSRRESRTSARGPGASAAATTATALATLAAATFLVGELVEEE